MTHLLIVFSIFVWLAVSNRWLCCCECQLKILLSCHIILDTFEKNIHPRCVLVVIRLYLQCLRLIRGSYLSTPKGTHDSSECEDLC